MKLDELGMNRFMYKAPQVNVTESPVYMMATPNSLKESNSNKDKTNIEKDAKNIITGTVITACLIKSSDQSDRIEIGQNLDSVVNASFGALDFSNFKTLDYLAAYRADGRIGFLITGEGAFYGGYGLPLMKQINLINGGTTVFQSASEVPWTISVLPGTGRYRVNHNLNRLAYSVSAMPAVAGSIATVSFATISSKGLNSFIVNIFDDTGGALDSDFDCSVFIFS